MMIPGRRARGAVLVLMGLTAFFGGLGVSRILGNAPSFAEAGAEELEQEGTNARPPALQYLDLYHRGEIKQMGEFLKDSSLMEDPTAAGFGMGLHQVGREKIVAKLEELFAAVGNPEFRTELEFTTGAYGVSGGTFTYDAPGSSVGRAEETIRVELPVVSVVEMDEKGKIVAHRDYADYDGMLSRLMAGGKEK